MSRVGISIGVRLKLNSIEPLFLGVPSKIGEHTAALVEEIVQRNDDFGDREIEHESSMVGVGGSVGFCNSWARVVNLTRLETLASIYCGKATAISSPIMKTSSPALFRTRSWAIRLVA